MREASSDFAADPCSSMKRGAMVRAARGLLSAVTRLLILADMVDVHLLLTTLHSVRHWHIIYSEVFCIILNCVNREIVFFFNPIIF